MSDESEDAGGFQFIIHHSAFIISFKLEPCGNAPIKFSDCFIDDQHKPARHKRTVMSAE
jgi:hypothetical protein